MGPNMLKYEKQYNMNTKTMTKKQAQAALKSIKDNQIAQILELPPILARGVNDHLIEYEPEVDPPKLRWRKDLLETMDTGVLMGVKNLLENRKEAQTARY